MDVKHSELLPCPFCSGEAGVESLGGYYDDEQDEREDFVIGCNICSAVFPPFQSESEAIEHWNTRANSYYPDKALIAELVEALEGAKEALKYCSNMAVNGMASHRDAIHGKCIETLNEVRTAIAKAGSDLTHRSAIDDVKELWFKEGGHE